MININEYKDSKNHETKVKELNDIIYQLNNSIDNIKKYAKYVNIMESLSILHNSRTLFEIELDKLKND